MSATLEKRLSGDLPRVEFHAPAANIIATVTFAAQVGIKNSVVQFGLSKSGTTPAVSSATLVYTKGGTVKTLTFLIPAAQIAPIVVNFASHPLEGDANTAITLTLPAMGATESGAVWMTGYESAE